MRVEESVSIVCGAAAAVRRRQGSYTFLLARCDHSALEDTDAALESRQKLVAVDTAAIGSLDHTVAAVADIAAMRQQD